jgi:hypothetical protein
LGGRGKCEGNAESFLAEVAKKPRIQKGGLIRDVLVEETPCTKKGGQKIKS